MCLLHGRRNSVRSVLCATVTFVVVLSLLVSSLAVMYPLSSLVSYPLSSLVSYPLACYCCLLSFPLLSYVISTCL